MSLEPVPDGKLAAVVTYLEMRRRPKAAAVRSWLRLDRIVDPAPAYYRRLFTSIGAPWLWFSRLVMSDEELASIIGDPAVELFAIRDGDDEVGMLELDRRQPGACELSFVGLLPAYAGMGHGRWLLGEAVRLAWDGAGTARVHVHTCTLDHPAALAAYRRAGFTAVRRAVEIFLDPRLAGVLPADCAPQLPLIAPPSS